MPEEVEVETGDLQDQIHEAHAEHKAEGHQEAAAWTRAVALTTAILAVFAAVGALQSGGLVNEAMMNQIQASDTWNEYQAGRQKSHLYTIAANSIVDAGVKPSSKPGKADIGLSLSPADRASAYVDQVKKEEGKTKDLSEKAKKLEEESEHLMHKHHMFAYEVAMVQVAIALGAVSALTRVKWVWAGSLFVGAIGVVMFVLGFIG